MRYRARIQWLRLLLSASLFLGASAGAAPPSGHIVGSYSDQQLAAIKSFTLPRVFLYDEHGTLIPQDRWPAALQGFKKHAGDAFCCVSDKPAAPGSSGPPPDCKVIYYGTSVLANFKGLRGSSGQLISYDRLPAHKYLLVEYFAAWCQPCVSGRKVLEAFFASPAQAKDFLWVSIDMTRLAEVQKPARTKSSGQR